MGTLGSDAIGSLSELRLPMVLAMLSEMQQVTDALCRDLQDALRPQLEGGRNARDPALNTNLDNQKVFHSELNSLVVEEDLPTYPSILDGRENAAKKLVEAVIRVHSMLCLSLESRVVNVTAEINRERCKNAGLLQKISRLEGDIKRQADQIEELQQDLERTQKERQEATGLQKQLRNKNEEIAALHGELLKLNTQFTQAFKNSPRYSREQVARVDDKAEISRSSSLASELEAELERVNVELRRFQTQNHQKDEVIEGLREALREMSIQGDAAILKVLSSPGNAKCAYSDFRSPDTGACMQWKPLESACVSKRLRKIHGISWLSSDSQQAAVITPSLADELQDESSKDGETSGGLGQHQHLSDREFRSTEEGAQRFGSIQTQDESADFQSMDWAKCLGKITTQKHLPDPSLQRAYREARMCLQETVQREKECIRRIKFLESELEALQRRLGEATDGMATVEEERDRLDRKNEQLLLEIDMLRWELQREQGWLNLLASKDSGAGDTQQNAFRMAAWNLLSEKTGPFPKSCSASEFRCRYTSKQGGGNSICVALKNARSVFHRERSDRELRCYSDSYDERSFRHRRFFPRSEKDAFMISNVRRDNFKRQTLDVALQAELPLQNDDETALEVDGCTAPYSETEEENSDRVEIARSSSQHTTVVHEEVRSSDSEGARHAPCTMHLEQALALRTHQVQRMLELNEALSLENVSIEELDAKHIKTFYCLPTCNEEIRTRFLDILENSRQDVTAECHIRQHNLISSTSNNKKSEHICLEAPSHAGRNDRSGAELSKLMNLIAPCEGFSSVVVSRIPTPRRSQKRRPLVQVPMYRPLASAVRDLASKSNQNAPIGSGDVKHDIFSKLRDQFASVRKFGVDLFRSREEEPLKETSPHVCTSSSSESPERRLSPRRVASCDDVLCRRKSFAWRTAESDSSDTSVDSVVSSESLEMQLSGHDVTTTVESLSTTESHTAGNPPDGTASAVQQCPSTGVMPVTARTSREQARQRRLAASSMYTDIESRRFLAYPRVFDD